jgi:hypothetical protein
LINELDLLKETTIDSSRKNDTSKKNKNKKLESSILEESEENHYIKEVKSTLKNQIKRRIDYLFDLFKTKGEEMIELKKHQIEIVENINHGVIKAEKATVDTLVMFLGNSTVNMTFMS